MGPGDVILIIVLIAIFGGAAGYIIKAKRAGQRCIGCPNSKKCSGGCCGNNKK